MNSTPQPIVRRVRKVSGDSVTQQLPPSKGSYRGFGTVPGETEDQFHDRMFEIDGFEAACYEMEFKLLREMEFELQRRMKLLRHMN